MKQKSHLIAIVGGSGAGKTWLAEQLKARLGKEVGHLSLDDFYFDRSHLLPNRVHRVNFDHPRAIDWKMAEEAIRNCSMGVTVRLPKYDFSTHRRLSQLERWKPKRLVLVDGLWLLRRPIMRQLFSLSIFLDCDSETRLQRRLERDCVQRGRSEESIRTQFTKYVNPMHERFVSPQRAKADVILKNPLSDNDVTALVERIRNILAEQEI